MQSKLITIIKSHWSKILSVSFFILLLGAYANIFAIGNPYNPGSTLDPDCAPGDENCTVSIGGGINPWLTSSNGIYYESGSVRVGNDGSINTEISGGIVFSNKTIGSFDDIFQTQIAPVVTIDNNGNPVIAYYLVPSEGGNGITCKNI